MALGALFFFALKKHNAEMGNIRNLPEMTLVTIDGHEFQLSETRSGRKTAIMFFSPDCEFCRQEGILPYCIYGRLAARPIQALRFSGCIKPLKRWDLMRKGPRQTVSLTL